jgi:hypothetical protein
MRHIHVFWLTKKRRVEIRNVGARTVIFRMRKGIKEGNLYVFNISDFCDRAKTGGVFRSAHALADGISSMAEDKEARNIKRMLTLFTGALGQSSLTTKYIKRIFDREGVPYKDEELPRIKMLVMKLFTLPDPEHVLAKAKEKGAVLSPDDVTRVCWGIHAVQQAFDEFITREKIY